MKKILSPAIRLMNQLSYRKKFSLLGLISLMAIVVLIYSLFLGLNQVVANSQRQLQGLALISPLSLTIHRVQQHRGLSAGFLAGNKVTDEERANKETEISNSIRMVEKYLTPELVTNTSWIKIKNNWNNLVIQGLNQSISQNYYEHSFLLNQLQFFKGLIADEYALTFDPKIDTFYLLDTSLNKLPDAMEHLAQIRAFSTSILAKKQLSEYQKAEMIALIAKLESALWQLDINLIKTARFNQNISSQLFVASTDITQSAQQIIRVVQTDILDKKFITTADEFFVQVIETIDKSYTEMYRILLSTTKILITHRLQQAKDILYMSIGLSLLLMLIVIYFGLGIYYSMNENVQSLTRALQLFADGDRHERINLNTQDELKEIANSFNLLAEEITDLLAKTESSKKKVQQVLDGLLTMAGILLPDGTLDFANATPLRLAGLTQSDVIGKKIWDCPWFSFDETTQEQIRSDCYFASQGEAVEREIEFAITGRKIWVDFSVHPVFDEQQKVKFLVTEARDATRRRLAEEHSKRSQKMDALGKLVGGIAHDFNNMLGVILGYAELMEIKCDSKPDKDIDVDNYINEIIRAGERGRELTRKMLAFSKSESSKPDICNINESLLHFKDMLAKSLTAKIKLNYQLYENAWTVWIDQHDLEDAILNLCINAKYAMPNGGSLTIKTENIYLPQNDAVLLGLTANDYLKIDIIDTGSGMDDHTKNHIFDPFFTTKGDAGNGLGLSQVFGFIERSGGAVNVSSELDKGSQFNLYFPRFHTDHHPHKTFSNLSAPQLTGNEKILVVDDEPALRELANQILTHFGYSVLTASNGEAALSTLASQSVDLMLSDVIMPSMDGYQLARQVSERYPAVKIQLVSGFNENRHSGSELYLKDKLLNKPYSSKQLLTCIRCLLDD